MNNQEPVFPRSNDFNPDYGDNSHDGMSLRAYIATHALQGIIHTYTRTIGEFHTKAHAELAIIYADALIAELNKEKKQ
jgi:hypothetical protein